MLDVAIMIEGQDGLNWPRWQRIVKLVEDSGYAGLYRSDHYTNSSPPDKDSLELWVSLTWLADNTERIEFGPLVTPVSFRHPTLTARMAAAVDDLSGARLTLGVGAGWQEREHEKFGWELLSVPERFHRYEEGVKVIKMLLESDEPVDFYGKYYRLKEAILLPRPQRSGGPPILIGGNGIKRSLPMAARYADEWNGVYLNPSEFSERNQRLNELLEAEGRDPSKLRRSLMTGCVFGKDEAEVKRKVQARTSGKRTADELRQRGVAVGTANQIADQLGQLAESGVQRVMLQWLELDDLEGIAAMAQGILHQI
jgi:F420-dependent oxidoreductase-like protein